MTLKWTCLLLLFPMVAACPGHYTVGGDGQPCTVACDGTSTGCPAGQHCQNDCFTCPCESTCTTDSSGSGGGPAGGGAANAGGSGHGGGAAGGSGGGSAGGGGSGGGAPTRHCPCLSNSDCDVGRSACVSGVCMPSTRPVCGDLGGDCCGGFCGTCAGAATCVNAICTAPATADAGTLGKACTANCDGTSNCDPGQYCPDSCLQCPCTGTCAAQGFICTLGHDETCDASGAGAIKGQCVARNGPYGSVCNCTAPFQPDLATGKCN